jgi:hypothetical protein
MIKKFQKREAQMTGQCGRCPRHSFQPPVTLWLSSIRQPEKFVTPCEIRVGSNRVSRFCYASKSGVNFAALQRSRL